MNAMINGVEIYYVDVGNSDGLPIIFVHGFPLSHEMWQPQIEVLEKFRVIAYDVRGHGKSGVGDGQYMIEFFVDDLLGLLDYLKIRKVIICGLSMGGYITLRAVERSPDRFIALILVDTQSRPDSNDVKLRRANLIRLVKTEGVKAFSESFVKALLTPDTFTKKTVIVEKLTQIIRGNSPLGICGTLVALASRTDTTESLPHIKVPTLILVGMHDLLTPPSVSQEMQSKIPGSEIHLIPNAAHMSNLENPEEFDKHLLSFLQKSASLK